MWNVWEGIKRNRGKIAAGVALIGGGIYAAKKAHDVIGVSVGNRQRASGQEVSEEEKLLKHRKRYVFEAQQESCDKVLADVIADLRVLLRKKFNCEALVERLKTDELVSSEKIRIWQDLQVLSFARVFATAHCYAFVVVAFKVQKAILCQEYCTNMRQSDAENNSLISYVNSFFTTIESPSPNSVENIDSQIQQLFSNCINYFTLEGLSDFCDKIQEAISEIVRPISLIEKFDFEALKTLLKDAVEKMDVFGRRKNYSRYVVPNSRPVIATLAGKSEHLQQLLERLVGVLESNMCRELLTDFTNLHFESLFKTLATDMAENKLPMAKIVPIMNDAFTLISSSGDHSAFESSLHSAELYRFLLQVFNT